MLTFIVFLNGMAIMVLEMAGARLLAPDLGTSIIVWTSLIGIILASLSVGYWLGGRLADKVMQHALPEGDKRPFVILSQLLLLASITSFMAAALGAFLPSFFSKAFPSLHVATVLTALCIFALPALLCGMVSPYAVRLAIRSSATAGATIGRLNAIGTVGSIVGTFLGGFVLLSWFSTNTIILSVALGLLAASALASARPLLGKAMVGLFIVAGLAGNAAYSAWVEETGFDEGVPIAIDTSYSSMRLLKGMQNGRDMLLLQTDPGSAQSGMYVDDPQELAFGYTNYYGLGTAMNPKSKRILMLGGGGYSVPKWLLSGRSDLTVHDFQLDVVELDPGMTKVATDYFKAPVTDPRMAVFHEDARTFVNRTALAVEQGAHEPYDLVFADIFNSWYTVPFHVGTAEAARNIHALLADDGVYIMNIITAINGDNGRLLRSIRQAFLQSFGAVHIFPVQQKVNGTLVQNVMLLACKNPERPLPDPAVAALPPHIVRMLDHRWVASFPEADKDVPALEDGYAPVERYTLGFLQ